MDGLVAGRIVYVNSGGGPSLPLMQRPAMVTHVYEDGQTIDAAIVVRGWGEVMPAQTLSHDQSGQALNSWAWMYDGQASRGNAK